LNIWLLLVVVAVVMAVAVLGVTEQTLGLLLPLGLQLL
jgi:hypothetical protein